MKKFKHYLTIISAILSLLGYLYFKLTYGNLFITNYLLYLTIVITISYGIDLLLNRSRYQFLKISKIVTNYLVLIFFIFIIIMKINVFTNSQKIEPIKSNADYIVILGAGLKGREPGAHLKKRLDKAIQYLRIDKNKKVIVSGGQGPDEVIAEALAMKNYLLKNGIPEKQILMESLSTTTYENLKFSKQLALKDGVKNPKFLIVSTDFHLFRASVLANTLDINSDLLGSKSKSIVIINRVPKEAYLIILSYFETIALP